MNISSWHKNCSQGRQLIENMPHVICPSTSVNDDNIEKVETVLENHQLSIRRETKYLLWMGTIVIA